MKVFFTGATGVIGRRAVPALLAAGHDVTAVARSEADREWLDGLGARPVDWIYSIQPQCYDMCR